MGERDSRASRQPCSLSRHGARTGRRGYHHQIMASTTKIDPAELEAAGLSADEAQDIGEGLDEIDRGEVGEGAEALAQTLAELDALSRARRAG